MSRVKDNYKQQQLFEAESVTEQSPELKPAMQMPEIDNWQPQNETEQQAAPQLSLSTSRRSHKLLLLTLMLITVIAVVEAIDFFNQEWLQSPLMASLYASVFIIVLGSAGWSIFSEWRRMARFNRVALHRENTQLILQDGQCDDVRAFCRAMTPDNDDAKVAVQAWLSAINSDHSDADILALYEKKVLAVLDKQARDEITRWSCEAAFLVAVSPLAALDMLLVVWRNTRMINRVAAIYGIELGWYSRMQLWRTVLLNVMYAGVSEIATELGMNAFSTELVGKISIRMAQGVGAGLLTARLGVKALHICRPMQFNQEVPPRAHMIGTEVLAYLKKKALS